MKITTNQLKKLVLEAVKKKIKNISKLEPDHYYKLEKQRLALSPFKLKLKEATEAMGKAILMINNSPELREIFNQYKILDLLLMTNETLLKTFNKILEIQEYMEKL